MSRYSSVVVLTALVLCACDQQQQQPQMPPPTVGIVTIKEQPIPLAAELAGRTNAFAVSEVRPQVTGIVQQRLFTEGSLVKAGQPLYQIDAAPYRAAYDSAAAALASAKNRADRSTNLLKQGAVAPQENDNALAAYKQALATYATARINLNYTRIAAPISGRIGASSVTQGALVTANQPTALAVISTFDPIYVDIDQSSSELLALRRAIQGGRVDDKGALSASVTLKLDDGSTYDQQGRLQFTDVLVNPATGTVRLRALFPNPDGLLLPGLYVRATVIQGVDLHGIMVPQPAIQRTEKGEPTVLVVDAKNFARLRPIRTGRAIGASWHVLDGLKTGDRVIVEGLQKVRPDMPVKPAPTQSIK